MPPYSLEERQRRDAMFRWARFLIAATLGVCSVFLVFGAGLSSIFGMEEPQTSGRTANPTAKIAIDYPLEGSVFPPEITAPVFLWRDPSEDAKRWVVEISFAGQSESVRVEAPGEHIRRVIDPQAGPDRGISPDQANTHTWQPDADTWTRIKRSSVESPARITISGFGDGNQPVSSSTVRIFTSADPAGAPIFYRDVPLAKPGTGQHGPIEPLPKTSIPLIKWRIRNLAESESHVVMDNVPVCINCHSFSANGKTLGLDLDGPRNDKGLYALVPVSKNMAVGNQNVIRWSSFQVNSEVKVGDPAAKRFGFMSQVSPDGRFVVTSIGPPDNTNINHHAIPGFPTGITDRLYGTNYPDFAFSQVFFPTRGILAFYDSREKELKPLPGADDPHFVHTSAFWSPDGKYLLFSRAVARDPYPPVKQAPSYANDPNETQIQYDLYKIPFNNGRGGKAVPVAGASNNGMSNNFPKVSPDGRWIVWVQNKNGLLMRPDSKLWIVPFEGGKPRLLNANTPLMNSWHSFSPNGRWLAFSSKSRSPYTQLMLTHIDSEGNDTPAIMVENTTAANRAVNIPEFVNIPVDGLDKIDPQATELFGLTDKALEQIDANQLQDGIQTIRQALEFDPKDAFAHFILAGALTGSEREPEALVEYRQAAMLDPKNPVFADHLAVSLSLNGDSTEAIKQFQKVIELVPGSPEYRFNLGFLLESIGDYSAAVAPLEKAVELSHGKNLQCLAELAKSYAKTGRSTEAGKTVLQAIDLATQRGDEQAAKSLSELLDAYQRDAANAKPK
jgi:Flp pilus assembly protein TadD